MSRRDHRYRPRVRFGEGLVRINPHFHFER